MLCEGDLGAGADGGRWDYWIPSCFWWCVSLLDFSLEIFLGQKCVAWMNTKKKKKKKNQRWNADWRQSGECGERQRDGIHVRLQRYTLDSLAKNRTVQLFDAAGLFRDGL